MNQYCHLRVYNKYILELTHCQLLTKIIALLLSVKVSGRGGFNYLENEVHQHTLAAIRAHHEISQLLYVGCCEWFLVLMCIACIYL